MSPCHFPSPQSFGCIFSLLSSWRRGDTGLSGHLASSQSQSTTFWNQANLQKASLRSTSLGMLEILKLFLYSVESGSCWVIPFENLGKMWFTISCNFCQVFQSEISLVRKGGCCADVWNREILCHSQRDKRSSCWLSRSEASSKFSELILSWHQYKGLVLVLQRGGIRKHLCSVMSGKYF